MRAKHLGMLLAALALVAGSCGGTDDDVTAPDSTEGDTAPASSTTSAGPTTGPPSSPSDASVPLHDMTEVPQVWFGPLYPDGFQHFGVTDFESYDDVFVPDAPWQTVSDRIHATVIYPVFLDSASPGELQQVLGNVADRGLAITFENGPLTETAQCNAGTIEGFSGAGPIEKIVKHIDDAGVDLYALSLEHGFDAATYSDLPQCHMTPAAIAADVAGVVDVVHKHFPNALVGSIETADLDVASVDALMSAYKTAVGAELDFFHLDVAYHRTDWATRARDIEDYVEGRGVPFGIFYFGDESDGTDAEWLSRTEARFVEFEVTHRGTPDHVLFQSWHPRPTRLVPESQPGTYTNLIGRYLRPRSTLTLDPSNGTELTGVLRDESGPPLADRTLEVTADAGRGEFAEYRLSGSVPTGATMADVGVRINTECDCAGLAALEVDRFGYSESGSNANLVPNGDFTSGTAGWGFEGSASHTLVPGDGVGQALRVDASQTQTFLANSDVFAVMEGAAFEFGVRAMVTPDTSPPVGYFSLIFLGADGEVRRDFIAVEPGRRTVATAVTDSAGSFTIDGPLPPGQLTISFAGDDSYWPTSTTT